MPVTSGRPGLAAGGTRRRLAHLPEPPACQASLPPACHAQVGGLYWVAVTRDNVSPSLATELLMRLYWICRDYFGYVSEEVGTPLNGIELEHGLAAKQQGVAVPCRLLLPPLIAARPHACSRGTFPSTLPTCVSSHIIRTRRSLCCSHHHLAATCNLSSSLLQVIRKNFLLVYELLDEVVDYGFPQVCCVLALRQLAHTALASGTCSWNSWWTTASRRQALPFY